MTRVRRVSCSFRWLAVALGIPGAFEPALARAQDSAPVLMSRNGGGGVTWSNLAELKAAAQRGHPKACAQLGEMLLRGTDVPRDGPRALALLEQAARAGEASAAFRLGMLLEAGDRVPKDEARALAYFRAAAAGGAPEAFRNVGVAYSTARGVKRDYAEALGWLLLAKTHGTAGTVLEDLRVRIKSLGHPEWLAAGERRAPEIERELAHGGVAAFLPPPAPLSYLAASAPPPRSAEKIPFTPENLPALSPPPLPKLPGLPGQPASADEPAEEPPVKIVAPTGRILRWPGLSALERAADRGDADALAGLGQVLLAGQLVTADPERAVAVLERGAKAGSADAASQLAELYTKGVSVARDDRRAFGFTLQAARGGVRTAIYNLGALYANGRGTESDYPEAFAWLLVAQHYNLDSGQAQRIRDYLAKTQPNQIPVAERRAAGYARDIDAIREKWAEP